MEGVIWDLTRALLPIGITLGIIGGVWLNKLNFDNQAAKYNSYIESVVSGKSVIICIAITLGSYILSIFLLGHKVRNVEMIESLKDNRD